MLDIVADPFECELLVHQPVVAGDSIAVQGWIGKPAQRSEAIIDGDDDDVVSADQNAGVESRACTGNKRTAMDEDPNGEPVVAARIDGCDDVEEETIFTEGRWRRKLIDLLRTRTARRGRIEYRVRARRRSGRRPTVRTGRRVGVADALELIDDAVAHPADRPARRLDDAGRGVGRRVGHRNSGNHQDRRQEAYARASSPPDRSDALTRQS